MTTSTSVYQMEEATLVSSSSLLSLSLSPSHTTDQVGIMPSSAEIAELNYRDDTEKGYLSPTTMRIVSRTAITTPILSPTMVTKAIEPVVVVSSEIAETIIYVDDDGRESIRTIPLTETTTATEPAMTEIVEPIVCNDDDIGDNDGKELVFMSTNSVFPTIGKTTISSPSPIATITPMTIIAKEETVLRAETLMDKDEITTELDCSDEIKESLSTTAITITPVAVATEIPAEIAESIICCDDVVQSLPPTTITSSTTITTATLCPTTISADMAVAPETVITTEISTTTDPVLIESSEITEPIVSCDNDVDNDGKESTSSSTRSSSPTTIDEISDHPTSIVEVKKNRNRKFSRQTATSLDTMDSMRPCFRKMRSTGMILSEPGDLSARPATNNTALFSAKTTVTTLHDDTERNDPNDTCSNTDDDDDEDVEYEDHQGGALKQDITSFQSMTSIPSNNYTITTNLDSIDVDYSYGWGKTKILTNNHHKPHHHINNKKKKKPLCDSHQSYRRTLEENVVTLKLQLAEAQERADTLQNDLNITTKQCMTSHQTLEEFQLRYTQSQKLAEGLATVVTHMQSNAKDCAAERSALYTKMDEYEKESLLTANRTKMFKFENRRLKKDVQQCKRELIGQKMEIQGLKSENEWFKKEKLRNRSRNNTSNKGCENDENDMRGKNGAISYLEGLPVIAEFREFLSPSSKSKLKSSRSLGSDPSMRQSPTQILQAPCANNSEESNINLSPSYQTRYTSFADIQLESDNGGGGSGVSNGEDSITKEVLTIPHLSATTNTTTSSGKKRMDIRRMRRKSSTGARNFFNALAQKHIQGSMEVSEDDASDTNSVASGGHRRRWSGPSPRRAGSGTETQKMSPTGDLPARWHDVAVATSPKNNNNANNDNDNDDASSVVERSVMTPSRWNWLWKSENNSENATTTVSSQGESQRSFSPWFLNTITNENDLPVSPPTRDNTIEQEVCGTSAGVSIVDDTNLSIDDSGFRNTLVPRRLDNPAFF